jgi:DNA end-binding protein Ku
LGTTLRYDYEVRDEKNVFAEVPNPRVPTEMLELAEHILETKAGHFDPKSFKDDYELAAEAGETKGRRREDRSTPTRRGHRKVINLMDALRRSVQSGHAPGGGANRSSKKPARRSGHRHRKVA